MKQDAKRWERIYGYLVLNWCMSPDEEDSKVAEVMEAAIAARAAADEWRAEAQRWREAMAERECECLSEGAPICPEYMEGHPSSRWCLPCQARKEKGRPANRTCPYCLAQGQADEPCSNCGKEKG